MCVDSAVCAFDTKGCAVQKEERGKKVDMCSQPVVNIGLPRLRCLVVFASEDESSPLLNTNAQSHMPDGFSRARGRKWRLGGFLRLLCGLCVCTHRPQC